MLAAKFQAALMDDAGNSAGDVSGMPPVKCVISRVDADPLVAC